MPDHEEAKKQVNDWLRRKMVPHDVGRLSNDRTLCPECGPVLLELFNSPMLLPASVRTLIAHALFDRKLNSSQKRNAVDVFLNFIRQNAGNPVPWLSMVVLNGLARNIHAGKVHEIGQITLDKRYGDLRADFAHVLYRIGNADAVSYLLKAARDPVTASLALDGLARLRVPGTLALCEKALREKGMPYKDAIGETYSKLKRQLAKKKDGPSHITKARVPSGVEEWSANLDGSELPRELRKLQKLIKQGFSKSEIEEVVSAAGGLSVDQTIRFKFTVSHENDETALWIELFCDDQNAYDLYVFGPSKLVNCLGT
jgi:hypothetical protein